MTDVIGAAGTGRSRTGVWTLALMAGVVMAVSGYAQVAVLGVQYKPDQGFAEHECFWNYSQLPGPCSGSSPMGATIHVFLRNGGSTPVTLQDVVFEGFSLREVLALHYQVEKRQPASIYLAGLTSTELQTLLNAGEPVWYKCDPASVPAGGVAQVVVRLRQAPKVGSLQLEVVHSLGSNVAVVPVAPLQPALAGASFPADLAKGYVYWRRLPGGSAPVSVWLDGTNVTASTTTVSDPGVNLAVSEVRLSEGLAAGSLHILQGVYADGQRAGAAVRVWENAFIYGTWGARAGASGDTAAARAWIEEAANHCVNALVVQGGSEAVKEYLKTAEGKQYAADHDYSCVIEQIGLWGWPNPLMWFIRDEPDAADSRVTDLPSGKAVGSLAQMAVETGEGLRGAYPSAPTTLNIDGTYKPFNWYNYGQVPDVLMSDPYYQARLREALWGYPERVPLYRKATYIYAVGQLAQSAAEPNGLHLVLYSCEYKDASGAIFPFAPPATKRIEVYYALAAGAKGLSYWWFLPGNPSNGLGAGTPGANALWREIGILGAEIRTAAPLLVTSCPAEMGLEAGAGVWARALLAGTDTVILIAVNDNYYNDEAGCHYTPVTNATVTFGVPGWMGAAGAFEVTAGGLRDVVMEPAGSEWRVALGTLDLTRMVVVTGNPGLRPALQQRYEERVRPRICALTPEVCAGSAPTITRQPEDVWVAVGGTAGFSVVASGTGPLRYQWKREGADIGGATGSVFELGNVQLADGGGYSVLVSNGFGSAMSSTATLTVSPSNVPPRIMSGPSDQTVNAGGTAEFRVEVSGTMPLRYQWEFEGGQIAGATGRVYARYNVQPGDGGAYRVRVENAAGSVTSAVATLTVTAPPVITAQPQSQNVNAGATAGFTVGASGGEPLAYQWQRNEVNLADGGHYSGCRSATLTVSGVGQGDVGNYRCVVTNMYGSVTSGAAALLVIGPCPPVALVNGSFEGAQTGGVASGWTAYRRAPYPTNTIWSIQTAAPPAGGGGQYQQIANASSAGGAGVRQDITGCRVGGTYRISGWMRGNSIANATCTVKCSPSASTNWASAVHLNPPQVYTGASWTPFSGTVVATGTNMTLWLDGQTLGTGQFKAECFDAITVTCESAPVPPRFESVAWVPGSGVQFVISGERGGPLTIEWSVDLVGWQVLTNVVNTNGVLLLTDPSAIGSQEKFYRARGAGM